jgi:ABC-2 type transport system permease protein
MTSDVEQDRLMPAPPEPSAEPGPGALAPRQFGLVNWIGLWTLYVKEVRRFAKVFGQTVMAPTVTSLLFLAIFALALGGAVREIGGVPYVQFLVPGLVMMAMAQNAFANTSSSIMIAKVQGNIVDMLMPPLSAAELTVAFTLGGVTRGLLVGLVTSLGMLPFAPMAVHDLAALLFYALAASTMMSLIGIVTAIWSDKFDQMAAVTNFVITPLAFLSGTFYSVERLPPVWYVVSHLNPFFYMIDGFRYGLTGHADGSLIAGAAVLVAVNLALGLVCYTMFATGYKLKE